MTHWMLVNSRENFERSRKRGFDIAGMKLRWRKAAGEVQPGDTVFFYVIGEKVIAGEAQVTGEAYFDESPVWKCDKPTESYPWRFPIEPTVIPDAPLPITDFIEYYEYARKWPVGRHSLAFQGNVHRLGAADYTLVHSALLARGEGAE